MLGALAVGLAFLREECGRGGRNYCRQYYAYLTEKGPTNWVILYLHFDPDGTGEVGPALHQLAACMHIAIEGTITTITASGREQLKSGGLRRAMIT